MLVGRVDDRHLDTSLYQKEGKDQGKWIQLEHDVCLSKVNLLEAGREATYVTTKGTRGRERIEVVGIGVDGLPMADTAV